jgi:23S rRNA U2552 (ribose-2'-O)-methylase RlmE/FtsJ
MDQKITWQIRLATDDGTPIYRDDALVIVDAVLVDFAIEEYTVADAATVWRGKASPVIRVSVIRDDIVPMKACALAQMLANKLLQPKIGIVVEIVHLREELVRAGGTA